MDTVQKNIIFKNSFKFYPSTILPKIFPLSKKKKHTIVAILTTVIFIAIPITIETINGSSYFVSYIIISTVYPLLYVMYQLDKIAKNCKFMP